jgi:hypothetical protein
MARPPKGKITPRCHRIAAPDDPAWNRWYEQHDPSGVVIPIAGPPGATPAMRAAEHKKIFARLEAHGRKYLAWKMAARADALARQKHTDVNDLPNLDKPLFDQSDIAEMLSREFDQPVSTSKVGRLIDAFHHALGRWPTTDTHSITTHTRSRKSD